MVRGGEYADSFFQRLSEITIPSPIDGGGGGVGVVYMNNPTDSRREQNGGGGGNKN